LTSPASDPKVTLRESHRRLPVRVSAARPLTRPKAARNSAAMIMFLVHHRDDTWQGFLARYPNYILASEVGYFSQR